MCKQEEEVSERLVAERLESYKMLEVAEDKYQQVIIHLKLMSVEQKLQALEAMEQLMSSEDWSKFQEERHLSILEAIMDQRKLAEHQERDLETVVQVEKELQARPVEEKPTVEPPAIQEVAD